MATITTIEGYITLYEAAKRIGVSHSQVWRYVDDGILNALRIGNTHLVTEDDVEAFVRPPKGNPEFRKKPARKRLT